MMHSSSPLSPLQSTLSRFRPNCLQTLGRARCWTMAALLTLLCASATHAQKATFSEVALGGPVEKPILSPRHKPTRLAQIGNGIDSVPSVAGNLNGTMGGAGATSPSGALLPGGTTPNGNERPDAANAPTSSQGALSVDLSIVRRLRVAGTTIGEAPMRVGNLDVLAPITDQLSGLGASASRASVNNIPGNVNTPSNDQTFQINLPQGAPIVLVVGKAAAYINQVEQPLRAAPLVMGGKIWLPIFSIAPLIGAATRLEPDGTLHLNPTVQSVELFPVRGTTVLTIKTSAPLRPDGVLMGTMDNPPKVYLDFPGYSMGFDAANSTNERTIAGGLNEVAKVRSGLFQKFPDTTRVVLDLKKEMRGLMQPLPDKTVFALLLVPPGYGSKAPPVVQQSFSIPQGSLRGLTIVVDAGHGGHDNGAMGARSREKDHALDIARRLRTYLLNRGATVLMTREDDRFISLQGRVDFANTRRADIFLSVHINSYKPASKGTETFYYSVQSLMLAREVHKELARATGLPNRGVSQARFFVIRKTLMPAILTETAFISNAQEEAKLVQPAFRDRVARGMAQGLQNYVDHYLRNATFG